METLEELSRDIRDTAEKLLEASISLEFGDSEVLNALRHLNESARLIDVARYLNNEPEEEGDDNNDNNND